MDGIELDEAGTSSLDSAATRRHLSRLDPLIDAHAQAAGDPPVERGKEEDGLALSGAVSAPGPGAAIPAPLAADMQPPTGQAPDLEQRLQRRGSLASTLSLRRVPTYLRPSIPLRERLRHFTFAWYSLTLSTSGVALLLALTPHRFRGLNVIGLVLFLFDLVIFLSITLAIVFRFVSHRHTFRKSLTRPGEALFAPTFFLSVAAQLASTGEYGRLFFPDADSPARRGLARFLGVMFWVYLGATFAFSVLQYHLLFIVKPERRLSVSAMTPAWILPIFPVLLSGTLASIIAPDQAPGRALAILSAGLAGQGLGFMVSVFFYATYLSRLMAFGLPAQRPGMFIAVGPPSFTSAVFIAIGSAAPRAAAADPAITSAVGLLAGLATGGGGADGSTDALALAAAIRFFALASAVFLWGLSLWFFVLAVVAVAAGMPDTKFHLSWWSFIFPNVGLTIATIRFGQAFDSGGLLWLSTVMTIGLFLAWLFIFYRCVRAVIRREIVWPGHDEDS